MATTDDIELGPGEVAPVLSADPGPAPRTGPAWGGRWAPVLRPAVLYLGSRLVVMAAMLVALPFSGKSLGDELGEWDGQWFLRAARHGWPSGVPMLDGHAVKSTLAFFPLFPLTIRALARVSGVDPLVVGSVLSVLTGLTASVAVWALVRHYAGAGAADRATLLFVVFPATFVFDLVYSEGIVLTLVAVGLLALLQRRWWLAGLAGLVATAVTPVALAFAASCAWVAVGELRRRNLRVLAAPVLAPLGFVGVQLWLWQHTGNPWAWRLTEQGGWHSSLSFTYPFGLLASFVADPVANTQTTDLLVVGTGVAVVCLVVAIRDRMPVPLLVYAGAVMALALFTMPVGMRPRFILLAFPLILAVGARLRRRPFAVVAGVSGTLMVFMTVYTLSTYVAFP